MEDIEFTGTLNEIKARLRFVEQVDKTKYDCTIKKHRERRSLNANAYMWEIIGKIAEKLNLEKEQVYLTMLRDNAPFTVYAVNDEAKDDFEYRVKYAEYMGSYLIDGKKFNEYHVYKGSSEMNTKEMARLIDAVVREATDLDIPTLAEDTLTRLKETWKK